MVPQYAEDCGLFAIAHPSPASGLLTAWFRWETSPKDQLLRDSPKHNQMLQMPQIESTQNYSNKSSLRWYTERTSWQPAMQFSVQTQNPQESRHETARKNIGLILLSWGLYMFLCSMMFYGRLGSWTTIVPSSPWSPWSPEIVRTSSLASSGSAGRSQTCSAAQCNTVQHSTEFRWVRHVSWDSGTLGLELHGIRAWNCVAKHAFRKPYESPLWQATKVAAYQILSDPIRSYRFDLYTAYPVSWVCLLWSNPRTINQLSIT